MKKQNMQVKHHDGFTLIELMITLVIVAILASVAFPSYQNHMQKARRADAYACLTDAAQRQESFFYQNNRYTTDLSELGLGAAPVACGSEGHYTLAAGAGNTLSINTSYRLTATRASAAQLADTACGELTLDSAGAKGNANASRPASECW